MRPSSSPPSSTWTSSLPAEVVQPAGAGGEGVDDWRRKRLLVRVPGCSPTTGRFRPGQLKGNKVGTGEGALELRLVQPEGKPVMDAAAWAGELGPGRASDGAR